MSAFAPPGRLTGKMWSSDLPKVFVGLPRDKTDTYQAVVRFLIPFIALHKEGLIERPIVGNFEDLTEDPRTHGVINRADVIYNRAPGDGRMVRYTEEAQGLGKRVIVDLDDDFWRVDPLNPSYRHMGCEEVWAERRDTGERKKIWETGKDDFDAGRNRRIVDMVEYALSKADVVTTTTPRLADRLRVFNPNTEVIPNPVDLTTWHDKPMDRPGFRIGWMGGDSHARDVELLIEPLSIFLQRHADAKFVAVGALLPAFKRLPQESCEFHEWVGMEAFPYYLQWMGFHLGLAPILRTEFNGAKSPLKWEEYGVQGVPTIATDYPPYSDYISSGVDGILVGDEPSDWLEAMERMYLYGEERRAIGKAAQVRIKREFGSPVVSHQWLDLLLRLREKKTIRIFEGTAATPFLGDQSRFES